MTSPANNDPDFYNTHWWEGVLSALGGSTGIAGLQGLTQEAVMGSKMLQIQANEVLNNLLGLIFDGLRNGVSLALAIIEAIAVKLFGLIPGFEHIEDAIEAIQEVPAVEALVSAITGVGGTIDDLADYLADRWTDLAGVISDIATLIAAVGGDVIEDLAAAIETAVENAAGAVEDFANLLTGLSLGDVGALVTYLDSASDAAASAVSDIAGFLSATGQASLAALGAAIQNLIAFLTSIPANLLSGALPTGLTVAGNPIGDLLQHLNASGQFAASQLTGGINTAVTFGGTALSTLLQYLNGSGQFNAAQLTGGINTAVTFGGTALSTLLQNLNSTGQFAANQLTGALNTAVTVGGTQIGTLLTNINSSGQFLGSAITGAINTAATINSQAIGTVQANAQGLINGINNAAAGLLSGGSALLADAATNLQDLLTAPAEFLQGVAGQFGIVPTQNAYAAAAAAAAAQAAALTATNAVFAAVFNVSPATAGNVSQTIDFTAMSNQSGMSGVMSPGSGSGAGYMGITSGEASWQGGTGTDYEVFPTQTVSDYQVIEVTLGNLRDSFGQGFTGALFSSPGNTTNGLLILFRCNSARTTSCWAMLARNAGSYQLYLGCIVSGTYTLFTNAFVNPSTGGRIKVIAGDPGSGSPYAIQVLYNNSPVITYTDSSHVSQLGASYRYAGLGQHMFTSGKYPAQVRSVTYQDNPPTPTSYPFSGRPAADPDAKGRMYVSSDCGRIDRDNGGAWENIFLGPKAFATQPPSSGWSWVNQGGASVADDADAILLTAPASTRNWRLRTRTLSPTSNYTATAHVEVSGAPAVNYWWSGIGLRNSSSGSFITFGPAMDSTAPFLAIYRWTNATTFSATSKALYVYQITGGSTPSWLQIRDDGTNRYFEYSINGVDWVLFFSEGRTAFITPNQFVVGADNEIGSGSDLRVRLRSLSGIS